MKLRFACTVNAKNGTHNTLIPRALATGRCDLITEATVAQIDTDDAGHVIGVIYFDDEGQRRQARAEVVIKAQRPVTRQQNWAARRIRAY